MIIGVYIRLQYKDIHMIPEEILEDWRRKVKTAKSDQRLERPLVPGGQLGYKFELDQGAIEQSIDSFMEREADARSTVYGAIRPLLGAIMTGDEEAINAAETLLRLNQESTGIGLGPPGAILVDLLEQSNLDPSKLPPSINWED